MIYLGKRHIKELSVDKLLEIRAILSLILLQIQIIRHLLKSFDQDGPFENLR